ncbi:MAG: zf-HC2 domain-containing protein [Anaerolineae bacterium]|nr:zf-HC2 domain-containing protein [Anaerolineae bacterium]
MRCQQASEWMSLQLDGLLTQAQWEELEEHLQSCPHCAKEWGMMLAADQLLQGAERVSPPRDLVPLVMARMEARARRQRLLFWGLGFALGALLFVWGVVFWDGAWRVWSVLSAWDAFRVLDCLFRTGVLVVQVFVLWLRVLFESGGGLVLISWSCLAAFLMILWLYIVLFRGYRGRRV